jgi:hypothetical protein
MKPLCVLALGLVSIASAAAPRPTNLAFILNNDQGAWTLGC